jgi:hypothetical protein
MLAPGQKHKIVSEKSPKVKRTRVMVQVVKPLLCEGLSSIPCTALENTYSRMFERNHMVKIHAWEIRTKRNMILVYYYQTK